MQTHSADVFAYIKYDYDVTEIAVNDNELLSLKHLHVSCLTDISI